MNNVIEGTKKAYIRVSTEEQNYDRQHEALEEIGCTVFYEEKESGTKRSRPELDRMLNELEEGDMVYIVELSRLSRSSQDLQNIVAEIGEKGANIKSLNDSWLDTTTASGKMIFTVMSAVVQFERDMISERTKDGLKSAKKRGKTLGRPKLENSKVERAVKMYIDNLKSKLLSVNEICEAAKISKPTLYKHLRERGLLEQ